MISKLTLQCPKEIILEVSNFLDKLFVEMKDMYNSYYTDKYSLKERNKVWGNIAKKYQNIFEPFIEILNKETNRNYKLAPLPDVPDTEHRLLNHAIKVYQGAQIRQNWPNPFEIDFLKLEPNDVATISCKIGELEIPHAIVDTGSSDTLFTDNIPKYLGEKIDRKNVHKLTGAVGESQSIGTSYNVPITIGTGEDSITVYEDEISAIPTRKDRNGKDISIMILGTKWQHRVGWDPIVKGEFTTTNNGKSITIPLSTRREVRSAFNTEKWHAPEGFKLPDSVITEEVGSESHCSAIKKNTKNLKSDS